MSRLAEYKRILTSSVPMIDVRAEVEFADGAFPNSVNLPILNTAERAQVGTCYKTQGKLAAIELGKSFFTEEVRRTRVDAWLSFIKKNPDAVLYCFRGGLRSKFAQELI